MLSNSPSNRPKFIRPRYPEIDIEPTTRHRIRCGTQLIDWFCHQPAHHQCREIPNAIPTTPTKTATTLHSPSVTVGANISSKSEAIGQIDADTAHNIPRPRNESVKDVRREIGAFASKEDGKQSPVTRQFDQKK